MSVLQVWLAIAIPGLLFAFALFYGRSTVRTMLGYLVLLVTFGIVVIYDRPSAAIIGGIAALLVGAGRGGQAELEDENTSTIAVPENVRLPVRRTHT